MDVRPFTPDDVDAVEAFLARIPAGEAAFFKEDISAPRTLEQWVQNPAGALRFLAVDDGEVLGYTAVIPGVGWSSHVADVRLVVDPERRRAGVGRTLARRALVAALEAGMRKLVVEVVADQGAALALFTGLGFTGEALLVDHIRDRDGQLRDLMVLAHHVGDTWAGMSAVGLTEALGDPS